MRQNSGMVCPLLSHGLCTPLTHADSVAVAPGREAEIPAPVLYGEAGAAQPQRLPQGRTGDVLPTDREGFCVPGRRELGCTEPALRHGEVGGDAKAGECLLYLPGREGDGVLIVVGRAVGTAVHRGEVGQGRVPDIHAGLGLPVGDSKIACAGRSTLIADDLTQGLIHKGREPGMVFFVGGAPVAAQNGFGQAALPPCGVGGEPRTVLPGGMVTAVERIGVCGNGLRLEGFVRPAHRHFSGNGT